MRLEQVGSGVRRPFMTGLAAALMLTIGLTGCGKPGATVPNASPSASASQSQQGQQGNPGGKGGQPTPERPDPTMAPTDPPSGTEFTFDQAAQFNDGVLIEIDDIKRAKANDKQAGAEGTDGQIVIATVLVTNKSQKAFDTGSIMVWGYYHEVGAPKIVDSSGQLGDSFKGVVQPGGQVKATMGFAMPPDQLDKVTIMIDGGTPEHGTIQFTGEVK